MTDEAEHAPGVPMEPDADEVVAAGGAATANELAREFVTMALYISLSLLAVTLALPTGDGGLSGRQVALTAGGLVLAHLFAFAVSSRLVNAGVLDPDAIQLIGVQAAAGVGVAVIATLPVLLIPSPYGVATTVALLVLIIVTAGYRAARKGGAGPLRALLSVAVASVFAAVVLAIKLLVE